MPNLLQSDAVAAKHKTISILVANAGLGRRIRDVADIGESDWDDIFEVNTRSPFVVVKSAVAGMRAQNWGRIILVGSIASQGKGLNGCHYAASKGALRYVFFNCDSKVHVRCTHSYSTARWVGTWPPCWPLKE